MAANVRSLGVEGENIREVEPSKINRLWTKFYDEGVRPNIDYPVVPLYQILDDAAAIVPDNVLFDFFGSRWTYKQVKDGSDKVANFLLNIGVEKGDRVLIAMPDTPHCVMITQGILKVGGIIVNCNPLATEREIRYIAKNSGATKMFCFEGTYPRVRPLVEDGTLEKVVICRIEDFLSFIKGVLFKTFMKKKLIGKVQIDKRNEIVFWDDVMKYERTEKRVEINPKEDVAVLQYTEGTTGSPKGVMLTHYNVVTNAYQVAEWEAKSTPNDVAIGAIPFFHIYGFTMLHAGIVLKIKIVLIPDPRDIESIMKAIHKHKATTFTGIPPMYIGILNHPKLHNYNLRSLRVCVSGASPIPVEVKKRWEKLTGGKLAEGYGLTEASPVTHCNPLYGLHKIGSIGIPYPDTYAVVVDEDGNILPTGEVGELAIFGPQVMKGYWRMDEKTDEALVNGWLLTGDLAWMDTDGYFYFVERKKYIILTQGHTVYPREVEDVLFEHPAVAEAAVVGVPDPYVGEIVKAYIVLKPEYKGKVRDIDLDKFCRKRLEGYKSPRIYEFIDELPKTLAGRVRKGVLKKRS